ncbi:hypothetical protein [Acinetobacter radioresistens]|uniref:hypothetical protein n=1 Tax=Acinetobacter radioresistens TaxID=40216 RepID=UPI0020058653|nr:hypothetical protein [Acinetobacter radioresistens]MCK4100834.1 hypothetical protein [Acinetobacter radioresistens]
MISSDIFQALQQLEKTHGNHNEVVYSVHISEEYIYLMSDIGYVGANTRPKNEWRISRTDLNFSEKLNTAVEFILKEAGIS